MKFHASDVKRRSDIAVIVPAYNEQGIIGKVVREIKQSVPFADIFVINDGSTDATGAVARGGGAYVVDLPVNLGIGGAVQTGLKLAVEGEYQWVMRVDGDGQHNPAELLALWRVVKENKADAAIGSRFCNGVSTYMPSPARRIGIKLFSTVVSWSVGYPVYDTTSGMFCLNRRAMRYLAQYCPQDYPEVEAHILFKKANIRVVEIPVHMRPRLTGVSSINALRAIYYIFKVLLATTIANLRDKPRIEEEENAYVTALVNYSHPG